MPQLQTPIKVDLYESLSVAIKMQKERLWAFKMQKNANQKQWNDAIRVLGQLVSQMRALVKDQIIWSRGLTLDERREVVVSWFETLTRVQQQRFLVQLEFTMNERHANERTLDAPDA